MRFKVLSIPPFDRQLKRLTKKFPSLKQEYLSLVSGLEVQPTKGVALGAGCYKIRLAIQSKGKGRSGGARIITCVRVHENKVYLLAIYDKSETGNIPPRELKGLLRMIRV